MADLESLEISEEELNRLLDRLHELLGLIGVTGALLGASPEQQYRFRLVYRRLIEGDTLSPEFRETPLYQSYLELAYLARIAARASIGTVASAVCPESIYGSPDGGEG